MPPKSKLAESKTHTTKKTEENTENTLSATPTTNTVVSSSILVVNDKHGKPRKKTKKSKSSKSLKITKTLISDDNNDTDETTKRKHAASPNVPATSTAPSAEASGPTVKEDNHQKIVVPMNPAEEHKTFGRTDAHDPHPHPPTTVHPDAAAAHKPDSNHDSKTSTIPGKDLNYGHPNSVKNETGENADFVVPEGGEFTESVPDTDPHAAKDPMSRNTWSVEAFHPTNDRRWQNKFLNSLKSYETFATVLGKYPFSTFHREDGSILYHIKWFSPRALWFLFVSLINFLLCIWIWIGFIALMTNTGSTKGQTPGYWRYVRAHEMLLVRRNFISIVIISLSTLHVFIVQFLFFWKHGFVCRYYAYWVETVELLRLDCSRNLRGSLKYRILTFIILTVLMGVVFSLSIFQVCQGTGATMGLLVTRILDPEVIVRKNYTSIRIIGMILFIYLFMTAKFSAIYFAVRCRILNNLVQVWNRRFRVCLLGGKELQKRMLRTSRAYLFKDHCVWLNLLEGSNHEFFLLLESFVILVLISFIFEVNHIVRCVSGFEFDNNRMLDFVPILLMLIIDVYYFYMLGIEAGVLIDSVGEAFDIIREKGIMTKSKDQELWFMLSMQLSLMGSTDEIGLGIVGWEFVYFSKTFMVIAMGLSFSFFVMYWQYQQPIDQTLGNDQYCDRIKVFEFLNTVEGARILFNDSKTYLSACNNDYQPFFDATFV